MQSEPQYKPVEQAHFSLTTAENACKFGPIHPERDRFSWADCDAIFAAAEGANQAVRGHNLCWHTENPQWLLHGNFNASELRQILRQHIHAVVTRYGTRALAWDVVNEAVDQNGLKPSAPWYPKVKDYIDVAFTAAREAGGPSVKLFYNDYSAEGMNHKSGQVYKLVSGMRSRGVPIDGVGLQFHWSLDSHDPLSEVAANMKRMADLDLEVHITELDIKCVPQGSSEKCTPARLNAQAELYAQIVSTCLAAPNCKSVETWGFTDKHTWIGSSTEPLPFDANYKPKPAVDAMINVLLQKLNTSSA
uniref:endo-1,4-beta-xylanase n=2 Tax=Calcidiscus leptoporus TaxID=127549 RepID=A0A7S0J3K3_9EUKA|mmetsp:Transcript_36243/g.84701  ORF Transcript_36243/g.84701 Transcript_36243/m.84701 type:complete len:304 (+) Transcript_36243:89-1000(+)